MADSVKYQFPAPEQTTLFPVVKSNRPARALARPKAQKPPPVTPDLTQNPRVVQKVAKGNSRIIRETFSLPPAESEVIENIRRRCAVVGVMLNRSEVIRAGISALQKLDEPSFLEVVSRIPKLKTGRPAT